MGKVIERERQRQRQRERVTDTEREREQTQRQTDRHIHNTQMGKVIKFSCSWLFLDGVEKPAETIQCQCGWSP